jgi:hypothetical protein
MKLPPKMLRSAPSNATHKRPVPAAFFANHLARLCLSAIPKLANHHRRKMATKIPMSINPIQVVADVR